MESDNYINNIIVNFSLYISIPLVIRFVILRKPIKSNWLTIIVLAPIFIGFSILINIQRDEAQKEISQELNIPYKPTPHMFGSPALYMAMILSYGILRKGYKKIIDNSDEKVAKDEITVSEKTKDTETKKCPYCAEIIKAEAIKCRFCSERLDKKELVIKTVQPELSCQLHQLKNTDNVEVKNNPKLTLSQRQFSEDLKRLERKTLARIRSIYGNNDK